MNSHEFEEKIAEYAKEHGLLVNGDRVAVALSGGADSVALLRVLLSLGVECMALHCNFGLREDESDRDEAFVRNLCIDMGVALEVKSFDVAKYEAENHVSTEMACRELRYEWFEERVKSLRCHALAVAHHHDDDVETFFLNMLRGSGIQGLAGIKPRNDYIIRPLLCVTRREVEDYLRELGQPYVVDSTNLTNDFKRNKIRNVLIPMLNELFPDANAGLTRTLNNLKGNNDLYQELVERVSYSVENIGLDVSVIDMKELSKLGNGMSTALYELLKTYGFNSEQVYNIYKSYCGGAVGQHYFSFSHEIVVGRDCIEIFPKSEPYVLDEEKINLMELLNGSNSNTPLTVSIETKESGIACIPGIDGIQTIALDVEILKQYPELTLREWRVGDRIKPYGMKGSKLVSDLFADAKYTESQKRNARLLCAGDDVLWVVGLRASRLFKVESSKNEYLKISFALYKK